MLIKKFFNAFSKIWIIVIALAVVAGGVFVWWYFGVQKEMPPQPPEGISQYETADWQIYDNFEAKFTFQYPNNWVITDDYFYETAAGSKAKKRTVILRKIGDNDSNNWISINPRQFQYSFGKCAEINGNPICTYSKNPETLDIFNQILSTFKFLDQSKTADWKTYKNEDYGFEVKYPNDWETRTWETKNIIFNNPSCDVSHLGGVGCSIDLSVEQNPNLLSIDKWVDDNLYYLYFPTNKKSFFVDGVEGRKAEITIMHNLKGTMAVFMKGNLVYEFNTGIEAEPIFDKILSTFRFLNQNEPVGWKTYRNEDYGFEVKYPENYFQGVSTKPENINVLFYGEMTSLLASENFDAIKKQYLTNLSISYIPLDFDAFKNKTIEYDEHFGRTPTEFMPIIIDKKNAYRFQSGSLNMGTQCLADEALIPIKTGGINIIMGKCVENNQGFSESEKEIFDRILSTFKFLK